MGNRRMVKESVHADQTYSYGHTTSCVGPETRMAESSTVESVDDIVIRSAALEERLRRLKDMLEGVVGGTDETSNEPKSDGFPSGLNIKLEKSICVMVGADATLQKIAEYLGFSV